MATNYYIKGAILALSSAQKMKTAFLPISSDWFMRTMTQVYKYGILLTINVATHSKRLNEHLEYVRHFIGPILSVLRMNIDMLKLIPYP